MKSSINNNRPKVRYTIIMEVDAAASTSNRFKELIKFIIVELSNFHFRKQSGSIIISPIVTKIKIDYKNNEMSSTNREINIKSIWNKK